MPDILLSLARMLIGRISKRTAFGLDISDRSLEAVWLTGTIARPKYLASARRELPGNLIENGKILNRDELKEAIKETLKSSAGEPITSKSAIISIPAQSIVSDLVILDIAIPEQDIKNEIYRHFLLKHKVKPATHTFAYYQVPTETRGKRAYLAAAVSTETVSDYVSLLKELGINAVAVDYEALATARAILPPDVNRQWALLDCGANQTTFSMFDGQTLVLSESIPIAGDQFTAIIMNALRITGTEAQKLKPKALHEDKVRSALEAKLEPIAEMIQTAISFTKSQYQLSTGHILLAGGSSLIEGFDEWWQKRLSLPVERARSFITFPAIIPEETFYLNAIGLALRGIGKEPATGFSLLPSTKKVKVAKASEYKTSESTRATIEVEKSPKEKVEISLATKGRASRDKEDTESQNRRLKIWLAILMITIAAFPITWLISKGNFKINLGDTGSITDSDRDSTVRETVLTAFTFTIPADSSDLESSVGKILNTSYSNTVEVSPSGTRTEDSYASGMATVYNKTASSKVIVANSRLQTDDGKLFRTQSRIEVPANGTRTVEIKAVEKGKDGNIPAQKLTFVNLSGMDNRLYAETSTALTGGVVTTRYFTADDLEAAEGTIISEVEDDISVLEFGGLLNESTDLLVPKIVSGIVKTQSCKTDQTADGETLCEFELDIVAVAIDKEAFELATEESLNNALSTAEKDLLYTVDQTAFTISSYDQVAGLVKVTVELKYKLT